MIRWHRGMRERAIDPPEEPVDREPQREYPPCVRCGANAVLYEAEGYVCNECLEEQENDAA